jgi:opacity protein-like surface antigen
VYTSYQDFKVSDTGGTLKLSPDSSTVRVGLAYNF